MQSGREFDPILTREPLIGVHAEVSAPGVGFLYNLEAVEVGRRLPTHFDLERAVSLLDQPIDLVGNLFEHFGVHGTQYRDFDVFVGQVEQGIAFHHLDGDLQGTNCMRITHAVGIEAFLGLLRIHTDKSFAVFKAELPATVDCLVGVARQNRGVADTRAAILVVYFANKGINRLDSLWLELGHVRDMQGYINAIQGEVADFHGSSLEAVISNRRAVLLTTPLRTEPHDQGAFSRSAVFRSAIGLWPAGCKRIDS